MVRWSLFFAAKLFRVIKVEFFIYLHMVNSTIMKKVNSNG